MYDLAENSPARVHRVVRRHNDWTLKEHAVLMDHWPDVDKLVKLLPHRSRKAIENFAGKCNLRRKIHFWTAREDRLLRQRVREGVPRKQTASELGLKVDQVANRLQYTGLRYARRPPKRAGHRLIDTIRARAYEMNMTTSELDEACKSGSVFRKWSPARKIHHKHIQRAVQILGGQFDIVWEALD